MNKALEILESQKKGVQQISGPCLKAFPVGQFWKPGDAGFRYAIPRSDIEFPGERRSDAKFRMDQGGTVYMINGLHALPIDEYAGEVMRTERMVDKIEERIVDGVYQDVVIGQKVAPITPEERRVGRDIQRRIQQLSAVRAAKST